MFKKAIPCVEYLLSRFECDPENGTLTWKPLTKENCHKKLSLEYWNRRFAGKPALDCADSTGRKSGCLDRQKLFTARVIFKIATGEEPDVIDHIDGDPGNNRISNLRSVTQNENMRNRRPVRKTALPYPNVVPLNGRFRVRFVAAGKPVHIGMFDTLEAAVAAYETAKIEYGFHPNHCVPQTA